ncbi:MAG: ABC transporter substrate-binding protein [Pseudomonadota bacterium]
MKLKCFLFGAVAATALSNQSFATDTSYPFSIQNCGHEITFANAPTSTVTVGQSTTEILYLLGLGDKVTGTSVWFNPVLPEFETLNDGIERLSDNDPSFEAIVNKKPELVTIMYEWHIGPEGIIATRESFHDVNVPTYVMPTDCEAKDNTVGIDGTRSELFATDQLYKGIGELAAIYNANDAGTKLIDDLKGREAAAINKASNLNLPEGTSAVFWFSSADMESDPYVAGQKGVSAYLMDKLGVENVVQSDEEWPLVGWETIAKADPDFIVVAEMDRRRFPADDVEKKLEFLNSDPVAKEMTAVKEGRVITIDAHAMSPTVRAIFALEQLSNEMAGSGLSQ